MTEPLLRETIVDFRDVGWPDETFEPKISREALAPVIGIGVGLVLGLVAWGLIFLCWWLLAA